MFGSCKRQLDVLMEHIIQVVNVFYVQSIHIVLVVLCQNVQCIQLQE